MLVKRVISVQTNLGLAVSTYIGIIHVMALRVMLTNMQR